ncbi:serine hydrolase [Pseudomonas sp. JS3066]|uniref:serine hydrolase domain-containing protein n=1 Tax=unclassified Pseudomonas TaxID=196821 RepID=UPI000EAA4C17|nr:MULTISPECIES: serine hydrolase [unclassified Pseudomonas]AYF90295.1 class C beta-lactamase-related serine hydrolase [Pseudomonas sp. DY-1]MDH4652539.1 serine hydrolase [Pseudomonas sp. BN606]MRK20870.1 serine hydrolase [Pseudomonas sp. JG-B]WVK92131.1 serine hydrolase [Pseudomonas sp. JS3066]
MPIPVLRPLAMALGLLTGLAQAETWPATDWQQAPAPSSAAVKALESYAFPQRDDASRKGVRTDAVVVIRDGELIYEHYAGPTRVDTPHLTWSVSKSLLASVLGVAYGEGRFKLDEPVSRYYPAFAGHPGVRLDHLLHWASGLAWQEDYEYAPLKSSVVAMLYTRGRDDMAAFAAAHPLDAVPGKRFRYSSGDTNVLSATLRGMVGEKAYAEYPWTALFEPLGIRSAIWETDAAGTYVGSSYSYLTARDLARVGLLMQRGGRWGERQLLPADWVAFNRKPFAEYRTDPAKPGEAVPGGHWWLNVQLEGSAKPWPDAPEDAFAALGHWGQALYVLPSQKLVIVRYADDRDGSYHHNDFLKLALAAFAPEVQP